MGWGRTLLLGDIGNRLDIDDVEQDVNQLRAALGRSANTDQSQDQHLQALQRENGELTLYLAALIRLLKKKGHITDDELKAMVDAIDESDGSADGQYDGSID